MPTVDDLVISLRIDDTSNLGRLQKQLSALVGPKGDKAIDIGMDANLKRDLTEIKDRLVRLTPTVLVEGNLKEAAFNLASDLKKDANLRERLLQRNDITVDKFDAFIEELFNITTMTSELNVEQKKSFIAEMNKFRQIADMERGQIKTMITRLTKLLQEATFHKKTVQALREAGIRLVSKPAVYEVTPKELEDSKTDWEDLVKGYGEKYGQEFKDIKAIFDKNSDTLEATGEAVFKATGEVFDITNITFKQIQENDRLMMVFVAQVASALKKTQWVLGEFYEAGQNMFTGGKGYRSGMAWLDTVVKRFDPEAIKQLGLKKVAGDDISTTLNNVLTEYKAVATLSNIKDEAFKRLIQQGYNSIVFIVEESSEQARNKVEELLTTDLYKGKSITLMELPIRTALKKLGIAQDLDELQEEAKEVLDDAQEVIGNVDMKVEEWETEKQSEKVDDALEKLDKIISEDKMGKDTEEILKAEEDQFNELEELMKKVDETTKDTNKKVSEEDLNKTDVEKDDSEGT